MNFPRLYEIATKEIIAVESNITLNDAIEILKNSHHRSIVVTNGSDYNLFSATDLIKIKLTDKNLTTKLEEIPLKSIPQMYKEASVLDALDLVHSGIEYLCIVDEYRQLYGLVTNSDILSSIDPETLMENFKVKDYFQKAVELNFLEKDRPVKDAMEIMSSSNSDCVIITDKEKISGILTIKDTVYIVSNNIDLNSKIENYYSFPIETIPDDFTIKQAIEFINEKHFKRVIASDSDGKITGIISQQELISYSYNHWASMMKNYHDELLNLNKRLREKTQKLQTMATTDMLTKLYNRHMFTELFTKLLHKKKRKLEDSMAIAIIDIDNFKSINDFYGHDIGDEVLKSIANLFMTTLRSSDISARWGGEEFILLLTNTEIDKAFYTIEKLRVAVEQTKQPHDINVTVSLGVTEVMAEDTLETCFKRADEALYKAKNSGKNKSVIG